MFFQGLSSRVWMEQICPHFGEIVPEMGLLYSCRFVPGGLQRAVSTRLLCNSALLVKLHMHTTTVLELLIFMRCAELGGLFSPCHVLISHQNCCANAIPCITAERRNYTPVVWVLQHCLPAPLHSVPTGRLRREQGLHDAYEPLQELG